MFRSRYSLLSFFLTAVFGFVFVPFAANADPAWPRHLRARYVSYNSPTDNVVAAPFYIEWSGLRGAHLGVNWCKAKDNLPAGWQTQDDRRLRTDSMCAEPPMYGGLGSADHHPFGVGPFEHTTYVWRVPGSHAPGNYVFSINFWNGTTWHHAWGNHTFLALIELKDPPEDCVGQHHINGPKWDHCHTFDVTWRRGLPTSK